MPAGAAQTNGKLSDLSLEDLKKELGYSNDGLSPDEAASRLQLYGYNELSEKRPRTLLKFLSYFWGPIPLMIAAAYRIFGWGRWRKPILSWRFLRPPKRHSINCQRSNID